MEFKKNTVTVQGRKVFYLEKNPEKSSVIVLLHGFPGSHQGLLDMSVKMEDYRLIIPDLPGCGQSETLDQEHTLKNYSLWLHNFLETLSIYHKIIIIGHSFGARLALYFSASYPFRVERLVLVTPVSKADSLLARFAMFNYRIAELLPSYIQNRWLNNPMYHKAKNILIFKSSNSKRRAELISINEKEIRETHPRVTIEIFGDFYKSEPISNGKKIDVKTLLIACGKDEIATVDSVKELCNRFDDFELKVMENFGHLVPLEKPLELGKTIYHWLAVNI